MSCAVLDFPARFIGISTQKFTDEKTSCYERDFEISKTAAFERTLLIIKELRVRTTHKSFRRGYIAAFDFAKSFDFCLDSTEAAFFISETSSSSVKIMVSSDNSLLARPLAQKFFELFSSTQTFIPDSLETQNQ
jgi:hypothetical protein